MSRHRDRCIDQHGDLVACDRCDVDGGGAMKEDEMTISEINAWLWEKHWENVSRAVEKYPPYGLRGEPTTEASFEKHPYWEEHDE